MKVSLYAWITELLKKYGEAFIKSLPMEMEPFQILIQLIDNI